MPPTPASSKWLDKIMASTALLAGLAVVLGVGLSTRRHVRLEKAHVFEHPHHQQNYPADPDDDGDKFEAASFFNEIY